MVDAQTMLLRRLFYFFIYLLVVANLIVFSVNIKDIPDRVSNFTNNVTNFSAIIRPADDEQIPVISPLTETPIAEAAPIAQTEIAPPAKAIQTVAASPSSQPAVSSVNLYAWGNCTWWAAKRRAQTGQPIPNTWGNASSWAIKAANDGYIVDHNPSPGAIMHVPRWGWGHVAYVENVDPNGTWHISEMNVAGLNVVDYKAKLPVETANYNFIHAKS